MGKAVYTVEVACGYAEWWRYNVYVSVAEFDADDRLTGYRNLVDRIYEIEDGAEGDVRTAPAGFDAARRAVSVAPEGCDHVAVYLYVIANTFPQSARISDSPPFPVDFVVRRGSEEIFRQSYEVNQWGGLTIAGLRVPVKE